MSRGRGARPWSNRLLFALPLLAGVTACAPVRIQSSKPPLFDVDLATEIRSPPLQSGSPTSASTLQQKRRTHMAELQALKNARIVGESRNGYLQIVNEPKEAAYRSYATRLVAEENRARYLLYSAEARKSGASLSTVETLYGRRWRDDAFPGELIQMPEGDWREKEEPEEAQIR